MNTPISAGTLLVVWLALLPVAFGQAGAAPAAGENLRLGGADASAPTLADLLAELPPLQAWELMGSLHASAGFKDNVLQSALHRESSSFVRTEAEVMGWRLPTARFEALGFVNGSYTRFLGSAANAAEWETFAHGEARWFLSPAVRAVLQGEGYAMNQIFDVSATSAEQVSAKLRLTGARVAAALRANFGQGGWIEVEPAQKRDSYGDDIDDNREWSGRIALGRTLARGRAELTVAAQAARRDYDRRAQVDTAGSTVAGGPLLQFRQREGRADLAIAWDNLRRWRTTTTAGTLDNDDNGSGYFNYRQSHFSQEIARKSERWSLRATGRFSRTRYDVQTIAGGPELRYRDELQAELRAEHRWGEGLVIFVTQAWENNRSNDSLSRYDVSSVSVGVGREW